MTCMYDNSFSNVSTFVWIITIIVVLLNWLKHFCQVKSNKVQVFCCLCDENILCVHTGSMSWKCLHQLSLNILVQAKVWPHFSLCPLQRVVKTCWALLLPSITFSLTTEFFVSYAACGKLLATDSISHKSFGPHWWTLFMLKEVLRLPFGIALSQLKVNESSVFKKAAYELPQDIVSLPCLQRTFL